jgi:hypothetical protein
MVVVPASTTAKITLRLPDLRAKNGLTGFVGCFEVCSRIHAPRRRDHILAIWLVVEPTIGDVKGTIENKLSSSLKVGREVVRALPKSISYV